jgi:UDP-N-acetylmuramoyl-tripeptide--D-alanyl-D-alanine ligase
MHWTVEKLIEATQGQLVQGDPDHALTGISTDTRRVGPGNCFVALTGESHDGHDFVSGAVAKGATALVVSRSKEALDPSVPVTVSIVRVSDTLLALGELARFYRLRHSIPVVGITGSNGKTSTKEMLAAILGLNRTVLKNQGNFNNLIGVPLTLLSLGAEHQVAVVEMGINVPGEMARLVEISDATVGLITNIHPAHLEGLHSMERILEEKSKLWAALDPEDLAVINIDDDRLSKCLPDVKARVVTYSSERRAAQVRLAGDVEIDGGVSSFKLALGEETVSVRLPVLGRHQVHNAVAAAAVAWGMGESPESIAQGLCGYEPVRQRMQMHRLSDGRVIIDDTYNANPRSMIAAVQAVRAACHGKPVVAVLGEMRELGPESGSLHRAVGREVGKLGITQLITLGELGREISAGARDAGMAPSACVHAKTHAEVVAWLREHCLEKAWIVVKGSRGMTMERVVEAMTGE